MTREEQIKRASVMYHLYYYDYSYEEGEHLDFYIKGFTEGARWADENINLESLWHNAEEEPEEANWLILCFDEDGNCWLYSKHQMSLDNDELGRTGWKDFINHDLVTKWAYVKDLVPKKNKIQN